MPYSAISTLSSGNVLTHTHLNTLQQNAEFLRDVGKRANWPCPSLHRNASTGFTQDNHIFAFRHWNRYLGFAVENHSGTLGHVRVFFNSRLVYANETPVTPLTAEVDTHDLTTWPNHLGAWVTATGYDADAGNGDGDIVSQSGAYYVCKSDHTSGAGTQPGIGGSWTSVWTLIAPATFGAWCKCWFHMTTVVGSHELAINYIRERAG